ncbi:fatty acid desaturase [Vulcanococcus sp.]|uniref:fatty acid desaturase n=1 Tax=Vulcanococcus sp. TaxID=2856995 RepID=UPI003F698C0F
MPSGILSAALLLVAWLISLFSLLPLDLSQGSMWLAPLMVGVRTALQTGLFITAHDAMHGHLFPSSPRLNHRLGAVLLFLYAGLPYRSCWRKHQRHHWRPGSHLDPDFCCDQAAGVIGWYRRFMAGYLSLAQMMRLLSLWLVLALLISFRHPNGWINLVIVCILPLLLSSLQLFVFGTYLPHRNQQQPGCLEGPLTLAMPAWLSLLACFHFGYHREHHEHPELAWFQLPAEHRRTLALS